jgi:hypothetical protein
MPIIMTDHMMNMSRKVKSDHGMCDTVMAPVISDPGMTDGVLIPIKVMSPTAICLAMTTRYVHANALRDNKANTTSRLSCNKTLSILPAFNLGVEEVGLDWVTVKSKSRR